MTSTTELSKGELSDYGTITVRVVVLPRKLEKPGTATEEEILDREPDEVLPDQGASPVTSYLERPKTGRLCCVFLVNGQRHDGLDNTFIVQQLGFKYLRKRMIIIVEVDGLRPEALGELMQGSRQGFYKGSVWEAISSRLIATLKEDPEIQKFEEEAEAEVARLEAGDQKVKEALDTLIEAHHHYSDHATSGPGGAEFGAQDTDTVLGAGKPMTDRLVSLLSPDTGSPSDYPVLTSKPDTTSMWIKPEEERSVSISSNPLNAWPALATLAHTIDPKIPELHVAEERTDGDATLRLRFHPPDDFDVEEYPLRATLRVFARFNGFKETRQLSIALTVRPSKPPEPPVLLQNPTFLRVSARQPVRLWSGTADTHVRLRWDGRDDLVLGKMRWTFVARCVKGPSTGLRFSFSEPHQGRFSVLIGLGLEHSLGEELQFEVVAAGPNGETLPPAIFDAVVAERPPKQDPEPRLISGRVPMGSSRRPPYELKIITRDAWETGTCFGGEDWNSQDAGAFQDPTEKHPLTLMLNKDMEALDEFKKFLTAKKLTENEVQSRLQKYTSHVAFHLYQMYQAAQAPLQDEEGVPRPPKPEEQRAEIRRVAMTLIRLMQVSR